ncbi:MAG: Cyanophycin synthetase [uncultured bacterium]|nr:MAG: Cyanophycin synthetase [uncultured bacterium]
MKKNPLIIKNAVLAMGGTIEEFIPERGCFYINVLGKRILLERKISITRQSFVSGQLTRCKDITNELLRVNGLPTPETKCFYKKSYSLIDAKEKLSQLRYPIILKDAQGSNSRGIFPLIGNIKDAIILLEEELPHYRSMIAQEMVFGKEYRILILDEKVIGALEMIPPYAVGDGVSTIRDIVQKKQTLTEKRTEFDEKLEQILLEQNFTLESVMSKNEIAYIKKSSCLAEGGETRDVTNIVHPSIEKICVEASKVVGKYLVGIDVMCEDISLDPKIQPFNIIEINGKPDLYIHYNPTHGESRNVVEDIVRFMAKTA